MVSLAYSYIYCLFFINHIKLHMMVSIRKHLYKVIFQFLYHYSIYIYSTYYKHDLECAGKQHENCLAVLKIKGYESTARWRDTQGEILKKGASVLLDLGAGTVAHGCVLVYQPVSSLNPLLFGFLWRLHYIYIRLNHWQLIHPPAPLDYTQICETESSKPLITWVVPLGTSHHSCLGAVQKLPH